MPHLIVPLNSPNSMDIRPRLWKRSGSIIKRCMDRFPTKRAGSTSGGGCGSKTLLRLTLKNAGAASSARICGALQGRARKLGWIDKATWKNKESRDRMLKIYRPLTVVLSARNPELARRLEKSQSLSQQEKPAPKALDLETVWDRAVFQVLKS